MRDFIKFLIAGLVGSGLALVIALPILLIDNSDDVPANDNGDNDSSSNSGQVFPDNDFLKFDDVWTGKLSSKSFNPTFSAVNPNQYICTSRKQDGTGTDLPDGEFELYRVDIELYDAVQQGDCASYGERITNSTKFSKEYKTAGGQRYYLSPNEKYILYRNNYQKQWRHSFFADYYIWDIEADQELKTAHISTHKQAQFAGWSPNAEGDTKLVWVTNNKDIYYSTDNDKFATGNRVTNDGGWCLKKHHLLGVEYETVSDKCMYNGVPEWNYEEEMVSSTNTIYWAPDGSHFTFVAFDVTDIPVLEYSVYPEHETASSAKDIDETTFEQFPRVNILQFAKTAGPIAKTKFWIVEAKPTGFNINNDKLELVPTKDNTLRFERGVGNDQENRYFTRISFSPDSSKFVMTWSSRAATQSKSIVCAVSTTGAGCKQQGDGEVGGVFGSFDNNGEWINSANNGAGQENKYHGWVGSFGPFSPIMADNGEFFTIHSKKTTKKSAELHPFGMEILDGYWNVVKVAADGTQTFLTDSVDGEWTVTELNFHDTKNNFLYFTAARGADIKTEYKRHVYRVKTDVNSPQAEPECVTCKLDQEDANGNSHCGWVNFRRNCQQTVDDPQANKRPMTYLSRVGQDFGTEVNFDTYEENDALQATLDEMKGYPTVKRGKWNNSKWGGLQHNYEIYLPKSYSENNDRKYPVFLEVYAGPEFQKVQQTFKTGWAQVHMPAAYDCIVVSIDGRGSAFQGDLFMFANYKALGQTERVDQTDFAYWLANESEYAARIDKSRMSVYGWSYGGYTTTHIVGYGGGEHGRVFTSGVAVAPLADWRFYDAMYAERYMDYTGEADEIMQPHWKNASMIERPILENEMQHFDGGNYHLIHGTNDDNVQFLSAARMEKALVERGIDFDNFFYADEDHSIRSTQTVQQHVYRNIITRIIKSWGYVWNGDGEGATRL
ncbi:Oidioi.mRNA.OKI2018_I69.XSR.g16466.t1.cds [Oikopleura dioica]|uniref:Oidioi.mRNA.OKI2018_I69.XSR.g16466.t1.cds n=1 Tax=Oikopleura dioica TaxID=34765 RepID=A0ABN7SG69_OIKDI|nr:Oidioi.mRNA.OKI2018_I69.XSR.g16466.t1.cds [Oikopleura dioica]